MISAEDGIAMLAEVERFGERVLAPLFSAAGEDIAQSDLVATLAKAEAMGLMPQATQLGFGLWEQSEDVAVFQLHLSMLASIARHSASLALEMHLSSLAARVLTAAGTTFDGKANIVLDAHGGLARYSLAKFVSDQPVREEDELILRQYFADETGESPFYCQAIASSHLLVPVWNCTTGAEWRLYALKDITEDQLRVHGLDAMCHYSARFRTSAIPFSIFSLSQSVPYAQVMGINAAGLIAIQTGVATAAYECAQRYAAQRSQGGCLIKNHAAVQQLLMNSRAAGTLGQALLASLPVPNGVAALADIIEKRAAMHDLFLNSATDALQVFGGYGYMQDYGIEKLVRDQNQLVLLGGSASAAKLFLFALVDAQVGGVYA
ncbi:MAG: acyl-CoA dehydrogenase family protein [Turneriella sp.]